MSKPVRPTRVRTRLGITIAPELVDRINAIVDKGKRANVSRVIEECLEGYLHIIEADCGRDFVKPKSAKNYVDAFVNLIKAVTDADLLGETLFLAYDKKRVQEHIKELNDFYEKRNREPDDEDSEESKNDKQTDDK